MAKNNGDELNSFKCNPGNVMIIGSLVSYKRTLEVLLGFKFELKRDILIIAYQFNLFQIETDTDNILQNN